MKKNLIRYLFPTIIIALSIIFLLRQIRVKKLIEDLKRLTAEKIIILLLLIGLASFFKCFRWYITINLYSQLSFKESFKTFSLSYLGNDLMFFGAGDIMRLTYISKVYNKESHKTGAAILLEKFIDSIITQIGCIIGILLFFPKFFFLFPFSLSFVIISSLLFWKSEVAWKVLKVIPSRRLQNLAKQVAHALKEIGPKGFCAVFIMAILSWLIDMCSLKEIFKVLGYDVGLPKLFSAMCITFTFSLISFIPGGWGVREGFLSYFAKSLKASAESGLLVSLIFRFFSYLFFSAFYFFIP